MFESELLAKLYMEPHPLTEEWLHTLLFRLWELGLHYNYNYGTVPVTWEEELNVLAEGVADHRVYSGVQLSTLIQHLAAASGGLITMYDKEVQCHLSIDPSVPSDSEYDNSDNFPARFGRITLSINGSYLN